MKFLFFIFTHKMGNKQTVTTNEHKAELELYIDIMDISL